MKSGRTYVNIDDRFNHDPKVIDLQPLTRFFFLSSLMYCGHAANDGEIGAPYLNLISAEAGFTQEAGRQAADALVEAGLFDMTVTGWRVMRYAEWQRSRRDIDKKRNANRDRQQRYRDRRKAEKSTVGMGDSEHNAERYALRNVEVTPTTDTDADTNTLSTYSEHNRTPLENLEIALVDSCYEHGVALTALERQRLAEAAITISEIGVTADEVTAKVAWCKANWRDGVPTPRSVAAQWNSIGGNAQSSGVVINDWRSNQAGVTAEQVLDRMASNGVVPDFGEEPEPSEGASSLSDIREQLS